MKKIIICTDSTCDLSDELIARENLIVFPLTIQFSDKSFQDYYELRGAGLYKEIEKRNDELPKTAGVATAMFMQKFEELLQDADTEILFTGIGSTLSSTYQNAFMAKNEFDEPIASRIHLVDSLNLSTGIGLLVMKMCDLRKEGKSASEIEQIVNELVPCVRAQFAVKKLDYLAKGGRLTGAEKIIGNFLRIRPILRVMDGKIINTDKIVGHFDKALLFQIDDVMKNIDHIDTTRLFITSSALSNEYNQFIYDNLPDEIKNKFGEILMTNAGSVVSAHCGEGTTGILYISKRKITM